MYSHLSEVAEGPFGKALKESMPYISPRDLFTFWVNNNLGGLKIGVGPIGLEIEQRITTF